MTRFDRALLISIIFLLTTSACNGNVPVSYGSIEKPAGPTTNSENLSSESFRLSLTISENIVPKSPTLTLTVQAEEMNSQPVEAQFNELTASWIADVNAQPGSTSKFTLTWSEQVRDQSLKLAQTATTVIMPLHVRQLNLDLPGNEFEQNFDADDDGLSNLTEITNFTNPFDSSDPAVSTVKIEVNVNLDKPFSLTDLENFTKALSATSLIGKELTMSFKGDTKKREEPVSDADFENVLSRFYALTQAIENKDVNALDSLATSSQNSDLFKQLIDHNYDQIEVSIKDIKLREIDKAIMGTLQIDSLVRPNGDRASLSEKYTSRKITSRRVNGDWTKIQW